MVSPIGIENGIVGFLYGFCAVFNIILHLINLVIPIPIIPIINFDINDWDVYNIGRHSLAYVVGFVFGVVSFVITMYETGDF